MNTTTHSPSSIGRATFAVCLGSFLVFANLYISHPLMPMLRTQFAITELQASWSLSLPLLTLGLSLLIYGPLSDAIGRRKIMLYTLIGGVLTSLLISQVTSYNQILLLRGIQGFLLGGLPALGIAYLSDHLPKQNLLSAVGYYISANSLGGVSGRIFSGWFADLGGWDLAFEMVALLSVLGLVAFYLLLPKQEQFEKSRLRLGTALGNLQQPLQNRLLLLAYLVGGGNFLVFSNQYSYLTYRLSEAPFSLPASLVGLLFLTYLSGSAGAAVSGRISQRLSVATSMIVGIVIMIIGLLLTLQPTLSWIILGLLICSFGFFLCHTMASSWVSSHGGKARASASALYLVAYYVGASVGSFYLDPLWQHFAWSGVIGGGVIILIITAIIAVYLRKQEKREASGDYPTATAKPLAGQPD